MSIPLIESATGQFGSDGVARAALGPRVMGRLWKINRLVTNTTSTSESELRVYRNAESPSQLLDTTRSANSDVSETSIELQTLETLIFVWSRGTPGTYATCVLYGTAEGR